MKKHYDTYYCPKYKDLKALGYIPRWVSDEFCDIFYGVIGGIGSPYTAQCHWYRERYGNFQQPTKMFVAAFAYGLDNINQFGGEERNTIYPAMLMTIRLLTGDYNKHSGEKIKRYIRFDARFVDRVIDGTVIAMEGAAMEQLRFMREGDKPKEIKVHVERTYVKKPAKRPYKILRLADKYE